MVLTVSFALSPVTGLFCHRRPRTNVVSAPGRADTTSANLTPASGRQDHTTSSYATTSLVRVLWTAHGLITRPAIPSRAKRCRVHRIPLHVRDDRETPLCLGGTAESIKLFLANCEAKYFSPAHWTGFSTARPSGKSPALSAVASATDACEAGATMRLGRAIRATASRRAWIRRLIKCTVTVIMSP